MSSIASVFIDKHTTSSTPDLHILYAVEVGLDDGTKYEVLRRYSEVHTGSTTCRTVLSVVLNLVFRLA